MNHCCVHAAADCTLQHHDMAESSHPSIPLDMKHCVEVFIWQGEPTGKEVTVAGLGTYVARPKETKTDGKAILFIHDIWGWKMVNNRLLCDNICQLAQIPVFMPDLYAGDVLLNDEEKAAGKKPDFVAFLNSHSVETTDPLIRSVLDELRASHGITAVGAVGYCWGGKYSLRFSSHDIVKAVVACHPTRVQPSLDLRGVNVPVLLLLAEQDPPLTDEIKQEMAAILKQAGVVSESVTYPGTKHGFSVRCDESDTLARTGRDQATQRTAEWFLSFVTQ